MSGVTSAGPGMVTFAEGGVLNPPDRATAGNAVALPPEPPVAHPVAPPLGTAEPLTAAYCAERAAAAIHRAETADFGPHESWLQCADRWTELATRMATHLLQRPHDDGPRR